MAVQSENSVIINIVVMSMHSMVVGVVTVWQWVWSHILLMMVFCSLTINVLGLQ